jgi:hypothetical protein
MAGCELTPSKIRCPIDLSMRWAVLTWPWVSTGEWLLCECYPSDHRAPGLNLAGFRARDGEGVLGSRGALRASPLRVSVLRDGVGCEEELRLGMQ